MASTSHANIEDQLVEQPAIQLLTESLPRLLSGQIILSEEAEIG